MAAAPSTRQFVAWDQTAATPVDDILAIIQDIADTSGISNSDVNTMILPRPVWNALRKNASLIDRIKYGGTADRPTQITLSQLKALFEIDNIYVPDARYNSAAEGLTPVYAKIWNNNVWVGYVSPEPSPENPSAGYAFTWDGSSDNLPGGLTGEGPASFCAVENPEGIYVREYHTDRPAARFVEAELWTTPNVTAASTGVTLTSVIT